MMRFPNLCVLSILLLIPAAAQASPINVLDPSFETLVVGAPGSGAYTDTNAIPGWTTVGGYSGVWAPTGWNFPVMPDGYQAAYTYQNAYLEQNLGIVQEGTYNVSAYFGRDNGVFFGDGIMFQLMLLANGVPFGSTTGLIDAIPEGTFQLAQFNAFASTLLAGEQLSIRVGSIGGSGEPPAYGSYVTIDNVAANITPAPVPEPGTMLLLGTGLLVIARAAKRKLKQPSSLA